MRSRLEDNVRKKTCLIDKGEWEMNEIGLIQEKLRSDTRKTKDFPE